MTPIIFLDNTNHLHALDIAYRDDEKYRQALKEAEEKTLESLKNPTREGDKITVTFHMVIPGMRIRKRG